MSLLLALSAIVFASPTGTQTGDFLNLSFRGDGSTPSALETYDAMQRAASAPNLAASASEKGELSFSQPIALPPAKLQPSVSLGYSAGGSVHSYVGRGWSVNAGLTLARPQRGGERAYLDGPYTDALMVSGDGLSGLLRYDGSDWVWTSPSPGVVVAEEQVDGSFVVKAGNREWTLVQTLPGTWRTESTVDRDGNSITYTWTQDRLDLIYYGNSRARVRFDYGFVSNPSPTWSASSGELQVIDERLDAITVQTRPNLALVDTRFYELTYSNGGEHLERIDEEGADGTRRMLAQFEYSTHDLEVATDPNLRGKPPSSLDISRNLPDQFGNGVDTMVNTIDVGLFDLTFDGLPDVVSGNFNIDPHLTDADYRAYFYTDDRIEAGQTYLDCDGQSVNPVQDDVLAPMFYPHGAPAQFASLGRSYATEKEPWVAPGTPGLNSVHSTTRYVDVDGDGVLDLLYTADVPDSDAPAHSFPGVTHPWKVCYGTKSGFDACVQENSPEKYPRRGDNPVIGPGLDPQIDAILTQDGYVDLFDVDADGWLDIVSIDRPTPANLTAVNDWRVYYHAGHRGGGWSSQGIVGWPSGPGSFNFFSATDDQLHVEAAAGDYFSTIIDETSTLRSVQDINGDGVPDAIEVDDITGDWLVHRGTGSGFDDVPVVWSSPVPYLGYAFEGSPIVSTLYYVDTSGSGSPPPGGVVGFESNIFIPEMSQSDIGTSPKLPVRDIPYAGVSVSAGTPQHVVVGLIDMNGDGLQDLFDGFGQEWFANTGSGFASVGHPLPVDWPVFVEDGEAFAYLTQAVTWTIGVSQDTTTYPPEPSIENAQPSMTFQTMVARDMNGDRLPDVVVYDPEEIVTLNPSTYDDLPRGIHYTGGPEGQTPPGILTTVVSGQGLRTDISYVQSTSLWPSGTTECDSVDNELPRLLVGSMFAVDPFEDSTWLREFDYGTPYCDFGVCWGFWDVTTTDLSPGGPSGFMGGVTYTEYDPTWIDGPRKELEVLTEADSPLLAASMAVLGEERWRTAYTYDTHGWPETRTLTETRGGTSRNTYGSIDYDAWGNPLEVVVTDGTDQNRIETHTTWLSDADGVLWVPEERSTKAWHWPASGLRVVEKGRFAYDGGVFGDAPTAGHVTTQEVGAGLPGPLVAADVLTWTFEWDSYGNVDRVVDPMGNETTWVWDLFGGAQWSQSTNPMGWTTFQEVDDEGRVSSTIDENGEESATRFDGLGRPVETTSTGAGVAVSLTRSTTSYHEAVVVPLDDESLWEPAYAHQVTYMYDEAGQLIDTTDTYTVSDAGSGEGRIVWTEHEQGGFRVAFTTDGILGQPTEAGWTSDNGPFDRTLRFGSADETTDYDGFGEVVSTWNRASGTTDFYYPAPGVVVEHQDNAMGQPGENGISCQVERVKQRTHDVHGRLVEVEEGDSFATLLTTGSYRYDGRARMVEFVDANDNTHQYRFDGSGRLQEVWRAGLGDVPQRWVDYTYDPPFATATGAGPWPTKMEIGDGITVDTTEWVYDALGRTTEKTLSEGHGGTPDVFTWSWDSGWKGMRDAIEYPLPGGDVGRTEYTYATGHAVYGDRGLVASEEQLVVGAGAGTLLTHSYDGQGSVVETVFPGNKRVETLYYDNGLQWMHRVFAGGSMVASYTYGHDRFATLDWWVGQAGGRSSSADIATLMPGKVTHVGWEITGREFDVDYEHCGEDVQMARRTYSYDGVVPQQFDYEYDDLDRLTRVRRNGLNTEFYSYDPTGNMVAMQMYGSVAGPWHTDAWSYDPAPRFAQIPSRSLPGGFTQQFSYDHVGRLLLQQHLDGGVPQVTDYTYDAASRLIEVEEPDGRTVEFWYDNDDQVVQEVRTSPIGIPTVVTRFGPVQTRLGADYVQLLPQLALQGSSMRYTLTEPDGRTPWVVNNNGSLYSEQYSTAYGLDYDTTAWGAVSTSSKWPLGGLHGAESENAGEVMHFGARHVALRGDGLWMQPEPLLAMGVVAEALSAPRALGGVYAAGNTNMLSDPSGYFTCDASANCSFSEDEAAALDGLRKMSRDNGVEYALPVAQDTSSGEYHINTELDESGYPVGAVGGTSGEHVKIGPQQFQTALAEISNQTAIDEGQLVDAGGFHTHNKTSSGGPSKSDLRNAVATAHGKSGQEFLGTLAPQAGGVNSAHMTVLLVPASSAKSVGINGPDNSLARRRDFDKASAVVGRGNVSRSSASTRGK